MKKTLEDFERTFYLAVGNLKHENIGDFIVEEKELLRKRYMEEITHEEFIKKVLELIEIDKA